MIGNPLEITDTVEHDGNTVTVMNGKILLVQFYKIGSKFILITVYLFLCFFHQSLSFCAEILQKVQGGKQSSVRILCHFFRCIPALLNCKCRFLQKTAFQDHEIRICCHLLLLFLPVADSKTRAFPNGRRTRVAVILKALCRIAIPAGVAACAINEKCTAAFIA